MLSQLQQEVIDAWDRPVLVMAPVGTGKTLSLARRAVNAIAHGVDPARMLCLSFTNRAAREVKSRLSAEVNCSTFHALCARILRGESTSLGLPGDFVIYDEEDCTEIAGRLLADLKIPELGQSSRIRYAIWQALSVARLAPYDEDPPQKPKEAFASALKASGLWPAFQVPDIDFSQLLSRYVSQLREAHAVDFTDLVLGVITLWEENPRSLDYWRHRFQWIQVDEVQDSSRSEYRILDSLGREHKRLSFFGDVDQTIYEWRGSAPRALLERYKAHYQPLVFHYEENFRSTRRILEFCERVITSHPEALTKRILPQSTVEGEPVARHEFATSRDEYAWLAESLPEHRARHGLQWSDIAILTRTNQTGRDVSEALERHRVPHVRVEEERFFQRAEIKCAIAHLRLMVNPNESSALFRFLNTPPKGVGEATLRKVTETPREWALKLSDLLRPETFAANDPHAALIRAWHNGQVTVLDTETTGLELSLDEAVELAARRNGQEFYQIIRPSDDRLWLRLEEASRIHGVTRLVIEAEGVEAHRAFANFQKFLEGSIVVGHNVAHYDWPLLQRQSQGALSAAGVADTLDLSRRLLHLNRYRLENVVDHLGLPHRDAHHAMEDVLMTEDVLAKFIPLLELHAADRRAIVESVAPRFAPIAGQLASWRRAVAGQSASAALSFLLDAAGIRDYFARQENGDDRVLHLAELERIAESLGERPIQALLEVASLGLDLERQLAGEDKIRILTVHQAKGLEFESVFLVKAVDGEFPSWRSRKENRLDEEHRLFYVAVSRAKRFLSLSYPQRDHQGRRQSPSPYLSALHS
jgi:DNA helicase-2/ATP-dependent DNA helicase PcrA